MISRILCILGFHSYKWGEIQNEGWSSFDSITGRTIRSYSRDFIVGECRLCGIKKKKFLT